MEKITTREAAKILGVEPGTLALLKRRGILTPVDFASTGRQGPPAPLWDQAEVEARARALNVEDLAQITRLEKRIKAIKERVKRRWPRLPSSW